MSTQHRCTDPAPLQAEPRLTAKSSKSQPVHKDSAHPLVWGSYKV